MGGRRWLTSLLAFLLVLQAVLPEFVMAARTAAEASAGRPAHHGSVGEERPEPGPGHRHDEDCPFCLARAIHPPLPPALAAEPPVPASAGFLLPARPAPAVRARLVLSDARPRAPPPSGLNGFRPAGA